MSKVTGGQEISNKHNLIGMAPIKLQFVPCRSEWLKKLTFIGETKSFEHLGHLPSLPRIGKYMGSFMVALHFSILLEVEAFLSNKNK